MYHIRERQSPLVNKCNGNSTSSLGLFPWRMGGEEPNVSKGTAPVTKIIRHFAICTSPIMHLICPPPPPNFRRLCLYIQILAQNKICLAISHVARSSLLFLF